jgi:hypothetical protein
MWGRGARVRGFRLGLGIGLVGSGSESHGLGLLGAGGQPTECPRRRVQSRQYGFPGSSRGSRRPRSARPRSSQPWTGKVHLRGSAGRAPSSTAACHPSRTFAQSRPHQRCCAKGEAQRVSSRVHPETQNQDTQNQEGVSQWGLLLPNSVEQLRADVSDECAAVRSQRVET